MYKADGERQPVPHDQSDVDVSPTGHITLVRILFHKT